MPAKNQYDRPLDKGGQPCAISLRLSDEDFALLKALEDRTGLIRSGVVKLALRTLRDSLETGGRKPREKSRKVS